MAEARRPVLWSSYARADLSDIWNYYAGVAGRHVADNIVRDIGAACRMLEAILLPAEIAPSVHLVDATMRGRLKEARREGNNAICG